MWKELARTGLERPISAVAVTVIATSGRSRDFLLLVDDNYNLFLHRADVSSRHLGGLDYPLEKRFDVTGTSRRTLNMLKMKIRVNPTSEGMTILEGTKAVHRAADCNVKFSNQDSTLPPDHKGRKPRVRRQPPVLHCRYQQRDSYMTY